MALDIPVPTEYPDVDPSQYTPLLLSAIGEFLQARDVWAQADYDTAYGYMEELKYYVVLLMQGGAMPIGGVQWTASPTVPLGWLVCDGTAILRTQYAKLFAEIGVAWGVGNGTTTFNLPDLRRKSPMGVGAAAGDHPGIALGESIGEAKHQLNNTELPNHTHSITDPGHLHTKTDPGHTHAPASPATVILGRHSGGSTDWVRATSGATFDQMSATASAQTGISYASAQTGITIDPEGGSEKHQNIHPVAGLYPIIFAGLP